MSRPTRRRFLGATTAWLGLGGSTGIAALSEGSQARADDDQPLKVAMTPEIAPLMRLIESTPREKSVAVMIGELKKGTKKNQLVAAMFLAAARMKVSPHHVYMIHAALRLSEEMESETQLLPLFWALDTLQYGREEGERFPQVKVRTLSEAEAARELRDAMDRFDAEKAESAIVSLARRTDPKSAMSELWRYAGRDDGFIGHRAIALVNGWRVLETIGWEHAEPMFQFVVRELNADQNEHAQHSANWERAHKRFDEVPIGGELTAGDPASTLAMFEVMRTESDSAACQAAFKMLSTGSVPANAIWDAVFLLGADFMVRYPDSQYIGTTPLHTNTSTNALRFAYAECRDPKIRLYTLLAAVAWATKFYAAERKTAEGKPWLRDMKITDLPIREIGEKPEEVVAEIFSRQPKRRHDESQKEILVGREGARGDQDAVAELTFSYASKFKNHHHYLKAARLLTALKSTQDVHDVKFPVAIFENYELVNAKWRPYLIAASSHYQHGTQMKDNPAVRMAKEMLKST